MANSSTIIGTQLTASAASDPDMCRVTGYFKDIHGNALKGREIVVRHLYIPAAIGADTLVLQESNTVRSNSDGQVQFDLYQGATVRIEIKNRLQEVVLEVEVPEQTSIDLVGLVYPYLTEIVFDDGASYSAAVDEAFTLDLTGTLSNGEELITGLGSACTYSIDDEDVVEQVAGNSFRALAAGTAIITISDVDTDELRIYQEPDGDPIERLAHPTITLPSITVTVT